MADYAELSQGHEKFTGIAEELRRAEPKYTPYAELSQGHEKFTGIAQALRRLISGKNHAFFRPRDFQFEAAQKILNGLPRDDLKEKIIALNNNPQDALNIEYIYDNPELLEAFPVLKQTYGHERPVNPTNYDESNKLAVERKDAVLETIIIYLEMVKR